MKFIRQNKEATQIINLELCRNIYVSNYEYGYGIAFQVYEIVFLYSDTHKETWKYDTEEERDSEFQDICSFFEFKEVV